MADAQGLNRHVQVFETANHGGVQPLGRARAAADLGVAIQQAVQGDLGLQPGERPLAIELAAQKARETTKDILLIEAVRIMGDAVRVLNPQAGLTAGVNSSPVK